MATRQKSRSLERRMYAIAELRVADGAADAPPVIEGHAAVFNTQTDLGYFREQIAPGAFAKSIKESDVRALFNHDPNFVLGRNKAGTLELSEDEKGLRTKITPPKASWAADLMESMRRGDISQMSFGFRTIKDAWDYSGDEVVRTLQEVRLFDVSPVTFPAYEDTDCNVRTILEEANGAAPLARALFKLKGGSSLTPDEIDLVRAHVRDLEERLGAPGGTPSKTEPEQKTAPHSNALLRLRMDLAEQEL